MDMGQGQIGETNGQMVERLKRELQQEREAKHQAIDHLIAFHDALRGIDHDTKMQSGVTTAIQKVPGLSPFITKQQEAKRQRDNEVRQCALLRMSKEEARALGLFDAWQGVHSVQEMKESTTSEWPLKEVPSAFADDPTEAHRYGR